MGWGERVADTWFRSVLQQRSRMEEILFPSESVRPVSGSYFNEPNNRRDTDSVQHASSTPPPKCWGCTSISPYTSPPPPWRNSGIRSGK